jgi:hypothetical protein
MVHLTVLKACLVQVPQNQAEFCPAKVQYVPVTHRNRANAHLKLSPDSDGRICAPKRLMGADVRPHAMAGVRQSAGKVTADDSMA